MTEASGFEGDWASDDDARTAYAQDYGRIVHERPYAVLHARTAEDIVRAVQYARRSGLSIATRGQGHQPFGQAQVRGGIVIDMRRLAALHALRGDQLEVEAGATWRSVVSAAAPRRRTPPVLPALLDLTVGGTLSIGGVGLSAFRYGAQVDQVTQLQVVTGAGEVVRCSEREHSDLFAAALAGQGQCAIITRAVLRLVEAQPFLREYLLEYADLQTLLQDEARLVDEQRFDGVVALIRQSDQGWTFALNAIRQFTPPDTPDDAALTAGLRAQSTTRDVEYVAYVGADPPVPPQHSHADLGLMIPAANAEAFLERAIARLHPDDLGPALGMRAFYWSRANFRRPLLRIPDSDHLIYVALLRGDAQGDEAVRRMLRHNRELFEVNRELGGTLYPYSALELTRDDWQRHYGSAWQGLVSAKRRYDPDDVFASGPDLFRRRT